MHFAGSPIRAFLPRGVAARTRLARRRCLRRLSVARLLLFPFRIFIRRGPRGTSLLASCGTDFTSLQDFISRTHITKRMTALTEYPAREEEFGTRARVLPLLRCTSALGTQIVAALRLRFRLRKRDIGFKHTRSKFTAYSENINLLTSSDRLVRNPLLPFGLSSPVPIGVRSSHLAGLTVHLYKILFLALT